MRNNKKNAVCFYLPLYIYTFSGHYGYARDLIAKGKTVIMKDVMWNITNPGIMAHDLVGWGNKKT